MARPSEYSEVIATTICSSLACGEPLVKICRAEEMPHVSTVYRWLLVNEAFRDMYARAREDQADTLADQIIDIADDSSKDYEITQITETVAASNLVAENIQRSKLRVDARKWIAAKLKPRKYGDKLELGSGDKPFVVKIEQADANL